MKPKKIESRNFVRKTRCGNKQYESPNSKVKKNQLPKLEIKKSVIKIKKLNGLSNLDAGEGKKALTGFKQVNYSKIDLGKQNTKCKNTIINTSVGQNNSRNGKNNILFLQRKDFSRKFSKYNDVHRKLNAKFKSTYNSSGKFDVSSTKYKAFVNSNQNKKNKSLLKHSLCNLGSKNLKRVDDDKKKNKSSLPKRSICSQDFKKEMKTVTSAVCANLPGKGTYNHRFAYDQALKLHQKGINVDVLYKVKSTDDSIYLINGEFLLSSNSVSQSRTRREKLQSNKKKLVDDKMKREELIKAQEIEKNRKNILSKVAEKRAKSEREKILRQEEIIRKQNLWKEEKKLRADRLNEIANAAAEEKRLADEHVRNMRFAKKLQEKDKQKQDMEVNNRDEKLEQLKRQQFRQKLAMRFKNNDRKNTCTIENNKHEMNHTANTCERYNVVNDIKRWVLRDGSCSSNVMSWLQTVACRIERLGYRVNELYKNEWMQIAIDQVLDKMTEKKLKPNYSDFCKHYLGHRKSVYDNSNSKVSSSFVVKTRRTTHCHQRAAAAAAVRRCPKISICCGDGSNNNDNNGKKQVYRVTKIKDGSHFRVVNAANAFGSGRGYNEWWTK